MRRGHPCDRRDGEGVRPADLRSVEPDPVQEAALLQWVVQHERRRFDAADIAVDVDAMEDALGYEDSARRAQMLIEGGEW